MHESEVEHCPSKKHLESKSKDYGFWFLFPYKAETAECLSSGFWGSVLISQLKKSSYYKC